MKMKLLFCCIALLSALFVMPAPANDDIVQMAYRTRVGTAIDKRLDDLTEKHLIRITPGSQEAWIDQFFWLTLDSPHNLILARMLALHCNQRITVYYMQTGRPLLTCSPVLGLNFAP